MGSESGAMLTAETRISRQKTWWEDRSCSALAEAAHSQAFANYRRCVADLLTTGDLCMVDRPDDDRHIDDGPHKSLPASDRIPIGQLSNWHEDDRMYTRPSLGPAPSPAPKKGTGAHAARVSRDSSNEPPNVIRIGIHWPRRHPHGCDARPRQGTAAALQCRQSQSRCHAAALHGCPHTTE